MTVNQRVLGSSLAHRCKVLVIDNITFLSRDALESAKEANDLMKVLKQLKSELALSILIIAHTPKRAPYKPISLKDMAGSSGLSRFADAVICIGKSISNPNQIYIKQLKVRSAEFQYGEDNVILMTIKKVNNFLGAYFQGYDHERNHLGTHHRIHVKPVQAKGFETEVEQRARNSYGQQIFHWPLVFRLR
jgi:hypothetical protein